MSDDTDPPHWVRIDINGARLERAGVSGDFTLVVHVTATSGGNNVTKIEPAVSDGTPNYAKVELYWNTTNALFKAITPFVASHTIPESLARYGIDLASGDQVLRLKFPM